MTAPDPTNCRACFRRERDGAPLTDLGCICGATLDFDPFASTSAAPPPRPRLKGTPRDEGRPVVMPRETKTAQAQRILEVLWLRRHDFDGYSAGTLDALLTHRNRLRAFEIMQSLEFVATREKLDLEAMKGCK